MFGQVLIALFTFGLIKEGYRRKDLSYCILNEVYSILSYKGSNIYQKMYAYARQLSNRFIFHAGR